MASNKKLVAVEKCNQQGYFVREQTAKKVCRAWQEAGAAVTAAGMPFMRRNKANGGRESRLDTNTPSPRQSAAKSPAPAQYSRLRGRLLTGAAS